MRLIHDEYIKGAEVPAHIAQTQNPGGAREVRHWRSEDAQHLHGH